MAAILTTYDFATKTFGHTTTLVGDYCKDMPSVDAAFKEVLEARKQLIAKACTSSGSMGVYAGRQKK